MSKLHTKFIYNAINDIMHEPVECWSDKFSKLLDFLEDYHQANTGKILKPKIINEVLDDEQ
jgi:hypothetical protein